jgi:hypothetical protein
MECGYCLGKEPESKWKDRSAKGVTEYGMWFRSATPYTTYSIRLAHRLIHKKYGFTIEMHDCVDLGD